jgi:hypothetical protein
VAYKRPHLPNNNIIKLFKQELEKPVSLNHCKFH